MPKAIAGFFCEFCREEANSKLMFLGTFTGGGMNVSSFPFTGGITPVMILDSPMSEVRQLGVRVVGRGGAIFGQLNFEFEAPPAEPEPRSESCVVPMPQLAITLSSADVLELWVRVNGGEDTRAATLAIKQGQVGRAEA